MTIELHYPVRNGFIALLAAAMSSCLPDPGERCGNGYCPVGYYCSESRRGDHCLLIGTTAGDCGNGKLEGSEECDDGDNDSGDACNPDCMEPWCGDDYRDSDEQCDDGNRVPGDGCNEKCKMEVCGNGHVDPPHEECDCGPEPLNGFCLWPPAQDGGPPAGTCSACKLQDDSQLPPDRR